MDNQEWNLETLVTFETQDTMKSVMIVKIIILNIISFLISHTIYIR